MDGFANVTQRGDR